FTISHSRYGAVRWNDCHGLRKRISRYEQRPQCKNNRTRTCGDDTTAYSNVLRHDSLAFSAELAVATSSQHFVLTNTTRLLAGHLRQVCYGLWTAPLY